MYFQEKSRFNLKFGNPIEVLEKGAANYLNPLCKLPEIGSKAQYGFQKLFFSPPLSGYSQFSQRWLCHLRFPQSLCLSKFPSLFSSGNLAHPYCLVLLISLSLLFYYLTAMALSNFTKPFELVSMRNTHAPKCEYCTLLYYISV